MNPMPDLETKHKITSWQLAVMIAATGIGSQIILAPAALIHDTGQWGWISVLLGGAIYFFCAYLMLRLASFFPEESLVAYLPRLFGKWIGLLLLLWFLLLFYCQFITILRGFSRVIAYTMFYKTPENAIGFLFLLLCIYGASQSWGTLLRLQQAILFGTLFPLFLIWLSSLLNFQYENLLPLMPSKLFPVLRGIYDSWNFYSGYEIILIIFPLVYRAGAAKTKTVAAAFGFMCFLFTSVILITVAVLSSKMAADLTTPSLTVIKGVEIPGTFLERLELYLLMFWIPTVYDTMIIFLAVPAFVLTEYFGKTDHRKYVLILAALSGVIAFCLDKIPLYKKAEMLTTLLGVVFSGFATPLMLTVAYIKSKKEKRRND
jgi:spore germination protein